MSTNKRSVFFIGPGYIGLDVIDLLVEEGFSVTALVRREEAAKELETGGVRTVLGTLADQDTIQKQVEQNDIVFHTATADDMASVEAVIAGIKSRAEQGKQTIYIHTSGASFLSDESMSEFKGDKIYSDLHPEDLDARPDSASHRLIDLAIIKARKELATKAKLFIMMPPLIYGANPKHSRLSIQIPTMARFAMKHKYAGHAGKGEAVWSLVHVSDLARAYMAILRWALESGDDAALESPYFFCESGEEISWRDYAAVIGKGLHEAGKIEDPEPREVPREDFGDLFGQYTFVVIGANSRSRAERLRKMGWKPRERSAREAFEKEELPLLLKEDGSFSGYAGAAASGATS